MCKVPGKMTSRKKARAVPLPHCPEGDLKKGRTMLAMCPDSPTLKSHQAVLYYHVLLPLCYRLNFVSVLKRITTNVKDQLKFNIVPQIILRVFSLRVFNSVYA